MFKFQNVMSLLTAVKNHVVDGNVRQLEISLSLHFKHRGLNSDPGENESTVADVITTL